MSHDPENLSFRRRVGLVLRGSLPLLIVACAVLAGPTLLVWLVLGGGVLGWQHVMLGGGLSLLLLLVLALVFGWAIGRLGRDHHRWRKR